MRKFGPKTLFASVVNLVSSTNNDGYSSALRRSWQQIGQRFSQTPVKSSLAEVREKVSSDFFKDIFQKDLKSSKRLTYRGMYIYAADGDVLDLPSSEDVLDKGYRGHQWSKTEETHYPKMYTVQAIDLISGETRGFAYSHQPGECRLAWPMIDQFEKNSITIYDRLYDSFETAKRHINAGSYFFIRVKSKNPSLALAIQEFCRSKKRSAWIKLFPPYRQRPHPPLEIRLIKVKNKGKGEDFVFMTNVAEGLISNKDAASFYLRRWGIEGAFKNLTDTLKMCQWHSKKLNGILQEIYALLWLVNQVRRLTAGIAVQSKRWLSLEYEKVNFKAAMLTLTDNLALLFRRKYRTLNRLMVYWATRGIEKRKHLSRSYPRQVKRRGKEYINASRVGRRPTAAA